MSFWTSQANVTTIGDNTGTAYSAGNPLPSRLFDGASTALGTATNPLTNNPQAPAAANILVGQRSDTATTAAATILTIPAGRTWQGVLTIATASDTVAAGTTVGQADGVFSISGANATPPAGTLFSSKSRNGANATTGTVGSQSANSTSMTVTIIAPIGNAVNIQAASTLGGTNSTVDFAAVGVLIA